jgi:CDP-diacylglycerol--glycerol-3-phosphate 3-phosphatidyltransferase
MDTPKPGKDFERFRRSGMARGLTRAIGAGFVTARTRVALFLIGLGVRPNHLTLAGFAITLVAAGCFVVGAGHHAPYEEEIAGVPRSFWPLLAAVFLILSGACDMLDGAVARLGDSGTEFGGVLDSTLDRLCDIAVYLGMCIHFARIGNVTYVTLSVLAMCHGYMISYVKARAEEYVDDCSVGYWLRGERVVGLLLACLCFHVPAWLWLQATAPAGTVLRRLWHAHIALRTAGIGKLPGPDAARKGVLSAILRGDCPRGSAVYDIVTGTAIASYVVAPWIHPFFYGGSDPFGRLLSSILSA